MASQQVYTAAQALPKARHYCAYQERCHSEVREKLYSLGLGKQEVELCLATLIEEDYLNEERFARQFAGGKFRMKQWGRVKISHELKQKQVSPYCIRQGLKEIAEEDYQRTMHKLALEKWASLKGEKNRFTKLRRTRDYLLQKGYESDLAGQVIADL